MTLSLVNAAVAALSLFSVAEAGPCKPRPSHLSSLTSDGPHHQTSTGTSLATSAHTTHTDLPWVTTTTTHPVTTTTTATTKPADTTTTHPVTTTTTTTKPVDTTTTSTTSTTAPGTTSTTCTTSTTSTTALATTSTTSTTAPATTSTTSTTSTTKWTTSTTTTKATTTTSKACTVPTAAPGGKKNVVYYTNWSIYDRQFNPQDLPSNKITHVLHSFANVQADGTVFLSDPWADIQKQFSTDTAETGTNVYGIMKQLYLLKKSNRKLKVQLSIGGASFSANFPTAASTVANRERFAKSAVKLVADLGLDGLDIDWEFPTTKAEGDNYVSLLKAVRVELDAYSKKSASCYRFLLTIAASAGPATYAIQPLAALAKTVDWFNLMAYDYSGSWSGTAAHQANLYKSNDTLVTPFSTKAAVDAYLATGVAAKQIVLGMPIYGRAFSNTAGLGKPFSGQPAGTWGEAGVYDYKVLPRPGALEFTDAASGATYSYDATKKELVTYDTPEMVRAKVVWAKNKQLGGSMFWEASADKTGDKSLIAKSAGEWGNAALDGSVNQLEYPESVYANLKAGMV